MKSRTFKLFSILIVLGLIQMACSAVSIPLSTQIQTQQTQVAVTQLPNGSLPQSTATVIPAPAITSNEPFKITGSFKWTSEIQGTLVDNILFSERQVVLTDLHGFIIRDKQWELPVYSQVLGYVNYDPSSGSGTYELSLPEVPQGPAGVPDKGN